MPREQETSPRRIGSASGRGSQPRRRSSETRHGEGRPTRRVPLRVLTLALLTAILLVLCALVAYPFLHAITWGVALAIMAWPLHRAVRGRIGSPSGAAIASTLAVMLLIVVPGSFVVYQVGKETEQMAQKSQTAPTELGSRETLQQVPGGNRVLEWMDRVNVDVETKLREFVSSALPNLGGVAAGSIATIAQFLIAMFILFYVFRDRGEFTGWLREIVPLTRAEYDRVASSAADSVHANLYATIVTGTIDSATGTLLFWALGLPAPFLWGSVMLVLSILPVVGAGMVWVPATIYLAMSGSVPAAFAILAWGISTAIFVDYLLYARIAGDRMRMHPVPALLAFLGGLAIFGISGMILGPAIVAMTAAMLDLWRERSRPSGSAMAEAG